MRLPLHCLVCTVLINLFVMAMPHPLHAQLPHDLTWKNRVAIVFDTAATYYATKQLELFTKVQAECDERDLVVFQVLGDTIIGPGGTITDAQKADALRQQYADGYGLKGIMLVLVGKDGGVKLRLRRVVGIQEIFATIDRMPMRRQEMKQKKNSPPPK